MERTEAPKLTPKQRHKLLCAAADRRDWYHRLRERMDAAGWAKDDPVCLAAVAAWDAGHALVRAVAALEAEPSTQAPPEERPTWLNHVAKGAASPTGCSESG